MASPILSPHKVHKLQKFPLQQLGAIGVEPEYERRVRSPADPAPTQPRIHVSFHASCGRFHRTRLDAHLARPSSVYMKYTAGFRPDKPIRLDFIGFMHTLLKYAFWRPSENRPPAKTFLRSYAPTIFFFFFFELGHLACNFSALCLP